jgi:uncharacterized GH25 family protein
MRRFLLFPLAIALVAPPVAAHEYWLSPSLYRAAAGDTISVAAFAGTGFRGEPKPFYRARALRLSLRTRKDADVAGAAANGDLTFARWASPDDGGALLCYESGFASIELPAAEFDEYLRLEGLDEPLKERTRQGSLAGPGRERYARCAKTWIAGRDAARLTRPVGLTLELVPLAEPAVGRELKVRILYHGRPLPGALVRSWSRPLGRGLSPQDPAVRDSVGPAGETRTGRDGVASIAVDRPGEWMIATVHMTKSEVPTAADWQSLWASLTFALEPTSR